jgi:hypothetical protein
VNIILVVLLILFVFFVFLLLVAFLMRKRHHVKRDIIVQAPLHKVFDYLRFLKNQENFNKNAMEDADRKKEFRGTDGEKGFVYKWSGDKSAGVGEKEIMNIVEGREVEMEIRFEKPMKVSARVMMLTEAISNSQTKVTWSNSGTLPYPINLLIPMMEKSVAKDMDSSLILLKQILEKDQ